MEACIEEELPEAGELEEQLRHGVYLAKLAHFFAPETVLLRRIYDADLTRFRATGLTFRHTDNINYFLKALEKIKLPSVSVGVSVRVRGRHGRYSSSSPTHQPCVVWMLLNDVIKVHFYLFISCVPKILMCMKVLLNVSSICNLVSPRVAIIPCII